MVNKHKLYSIALVSAAMILMLTSIESAAPYTYITNYGSNTVSVIDTLTNQVIKTVSVGTGPFGVAVIPVGTKI